MAVWPYNFYVVSKIDKQEWSELTFPLEELKILWNTRDFQTETKAVYEFKKYSGDDLCMFAFWGVVY